ncbi:MAG: amidophosphoribosyltransferase [Bacteroidales bacterium]|nr:amidophosphoribosyltransferase [Bacteroidales bacterium]
MSELIKHECGIAMVRLLKPPEYYFSKYGTPLYGIGKLHLLMQKQQNRGQDGAGITSIKLDLEPGKRYIHRIRSNSEAPIKDIFSQVYEPFRALKEKNPERLLDPMWLKQNMPFTGELFLGHLRYGTYGKNDPESLHPVLRENNWKTRNLVLAGNFNMTNVGELFEGLVEYGQHPVETSDTITILEKIGHFLDEENENLYQQFKKEGYSRKEISERIASALDLQKILTQSSAQWDGGYTIAGLLGHGDAFVLRDPSGIRPAFYYRDEEVVIVASERPVIMTAFNVQSGPVNEIKPGYSLIIRKNGECAEHNCRNPLEKRSCSFERIYFSRGTDKDIYQERKQLGRFLAPAILRAIDWDLENTVFSYIPNTAAVAFQGLVDALQNFCDQVISEKILQAGGDLTSEKLKGFFNLRPRIETIAVKDLKLRTFITQENERDDLVGHVYDVTYGVIRPGIDNLVVIDDSIVRGTTLKQSIISILDRLGPKKIIVASSAPQIRYPDCYGIDMAKLGDFIAFRAAMELLHDTRQTHVINQVYKKCLAQVNQPKDRIINLVKEIYAPFSAGQISEKISRMLTTGEINATIQVIYQTIEHLHEAIPGHRGVWYFTGDYPTPGGNMVVNRSFINYIEGRNVRAY